MNTKQVIVMRKDLNMRKGKMVAQGAHASLGVFTTYGSILPISATTYQEASPISHGLHVDLPEPWLNWLKSSFVKVCLGVSSEEELLDIHAAAEAAQIPGILITDSGKTEFDGVKTVTCCAIGPWLSEEIDKITGHLSLL